MTSRVLQHPVFEVDGWAGNTEDDAGVQWWVTKADGWSGSPPVRLSLTDRPDRNGSFDAPSYRGARVITLEGTAVAPDRITAERAKDELAAVLNDGSQLFPLVVTEPHLTRQAQVRLSAESKVTERKGGAFDFSLQLTAPDPLRYSSLSHTDSCGLPDSSGGLGFPLVFPLDFGSTVGGRLSLSNTGTAPTWPKWQITGPCIDPVITATGTGDVLAFDLELVATEFLVIDTETRTVLLQDQASRRSSLSPRSRWFALPPGEIQIAFSSDDHSPQARLDVEWCDAWT
jgi:hypothetical protein